MKATKYIKLLATSIIGLTLCSCGGGGGGGGGGDHSGNTGAAENDTTTENADKPTTTPPQEEHLAPESLQGIKFEKSKERFVFNNGCRFVDAGGLSYSGSYKYTKTGPDTATLYFNLTSYYYGVETTMKTHGVLNLTFCKSATRYWVNINGQAASRVENSVTMTGGQWHYRNFSSMDVKK